MKEGVKMAACWAHNAKRMKRARKEGARFRGYEVDIAEVFWKAEEGRKEGEDGLKEEGEEGGRLSD